MSAGAGNADRRFYSTLFLVFAPLFMAGGWLATFTEIGAALIVGGSALAVAGFALRPSLRTGAVAALELAAGWLAVPLLVELT